jgi:hypothetical protein
MEMSPHVTFGDPMCNGRESETSANLPPGTTGMGGEARTSDCDAAPAVATSADKMLGDPASSVEEFEAAWAACGTSGANGAVAGHLRNAGAVGEPGTVSIETPATVWEVIAADALACEEAVAGVATAADPGAVAGAEDAARTAATTALASSGVMGAEISDWRRGRMSRDSFGPSQDFGSADCGTVTDSAETRSSAASIRANAPAPVREPRA